ncbi:DDE-type integrase/transposase/recombinase [Paraburkholderia sp. J41]|uniref:DDE-type integrase/transposase/recombinase n=1 Tax=Paraburkholderia sp. J41 TaxID=2805433 RepID=UPI002AC33663|nr:DDE-type integrase/transposase/recombinase [Paraburkholderia sp. J41]
MPRYSLKVGEFFSLEQKTYLIEHVIGEVVHVVTANDGSKSTYLADLLLLHFAEGRLKFLTREELECGAADSATRPTVERSLSNFPSRVQQQALRKWKYLNAICPDGRLGFARQELAEMLRRAWTALGPNDGGTCPPSVQSFYRWRARWVWSNFDVRALIDKWELRGRRPEALPDKLSELIDQGIEKVYLTPQRESLRETLDWIQLQIEQENRRRAPVDALPPVSRRMLNRALSRIDRYAVLKARYGERYAREATRIYGKGPACTHPLERVEVDHTPLDVLVVDSATGLLLGRPWITVMIDCYSRMIVGVHISFRHPSVRSVLRCLKHAILPKSYMKERFPKVSGEWSAYGLIHELVCDNGLEFHARDLEAACAELGTHVIYCPTRSPQMKGRIERFLKTLNYGFVHLQPGTTFAKYDKRHAYDSDSTAALTLEALQEFIHRWIVDVYSMTFHRSIQCTPKQRWDEGVQIFPPRLPPSADIVNVYLGNCHKRRLTKNGIEVHSLQYTSPALQDLRRRCGDIEVSIRTDPDNLGSIFILDEEAQRYIEAKSTWAKYAEGLSAEQHRWILSKARGDYETLPVRFGLIAAKDALRVDMAQIVEAGRSRKPKQAKAPKADRELMVQREETRQIQLPLEPESDESTHEERPPEEVNGDGEVPLFPVRRGPAPAQVPEIATHPIQSPDRPTVTSSQESAR